MGWKMDWRKFYSYLNRTHNVTKAFMFIGYMAENEAMYEQLHEIGYLIVLKPTVDVKPTPENSTNTEPLAPDGTAPEPHKVGVKGNIDADLVLFAMKELANYDKAIIVSGDGDFFGLVEYLAAQHKLASVMTPNWRYSSLLKPFESYILRIDQMRRQLAYHDHPRRNQSNQN